VIKQERECRVCRDMVEIDSRGLLIDHNYSSYPIEEVCTGAHTANYYPDTAWRHVDFFPGLRERVAEEFMESIFYQGPGATQRVSYNPGPCPGQMFPDDVIVDCDPPVQRLVKGDDQ
jgi:hypothetical protein